MRKIKTEEYQSLREEMIARVQLMYSHNMGMVTAVFAVWAIAGLFCSNFFNNIIETINNDYTGTTSVLTFGAILLEILFISPLAIMLPFSVKFKDNLGQISSLAGYMMVFSEIPTMLKNGSDGEFIGWEKHQKKAVEEKSVLLLFNIEYITLSFIAFALFSISAAFSIYWAYQYAIMSLESLIAVTAIIAIVAITAIGFVIHMSSIGRFLVNRKTCVEHYKEIAENKEYVSNDEKEEFDKLIDEVIKDEKAVIDEVKK